MWDDTRKLVLEEKWTEALINLAQMGIRHFFGVVPRMFGKRRTLIALWVGDQGVRLYGDRTVLKDSPRLKFVVENCRADYDTADLRKLFQRADIEKKAWGIQGGRIEVLKRVFEGTHLSILFFVEADDILFSREVGDMLVVRRRDRPIKRRDLLYYLEAQVRDNVLTSIICLKKLTEEGKDETLINSAITTIANAFHGIERMAVLEYTYYVIHRASKSQSRYSMSELSEILDLLEDLSQMKVEKSDAEGGILFCKTKDLRQSQSLIRRLDFEKRVSLADRKKVRKYLDVSDGERTFLLFKHDVLYGVMAIPPSRPEYLGGYLSARLRKGGKVTLYFGNVQLFDISQHTYKQAFDKYVWLQLDEILRSAYGKGFISHQQVLSSTECSERIYSMIESCRARGKGLILVLGKCEKYILAEKMKNIVMIEPTSIADTEQHLLFERLFDHMPTIDGATFIDENLKVIGFSAILPAPAGKVKEDPAHGARHNSALRFSKGKEDIFIVVLSEDGPLRLVYDGKFIAAIEL